MSDHASRFRLDGRTALVTGASRGLGVAIAEGLAAAGADLVLTSRDEADLAPVAARLRQEHGCTVSTLAADLGSPTAGAELGAAAWDAAGRVDVLVNNAGLSIPALAVDVTPADYDTVMAVNVRTPALLAADLGGRMAAAGGGRIVNVASVAGLRALTEHYVYSMSKAALIMAGKVLALELGAAGVRVNTVCPTVVLTEMGTRVWGDPVKSGPMLARISAGHFAQPQDVADAVVYLASDAAEMLNGTELVIDGGFSAN
ncbi:SDR family NAD(P)-dependent oxidoreductase [Agilicoccus flavus]|uniref:SDR family NAD(P)-dependent oxidoreductase n=1 Tax=Agilicoccus flavus TaxID=2775968 RepID=UPI001CF6E26A|nr:glucose 1-dehydrogenase [Agilicoccus flavus]